MGYRLRLLLALSAMFLSTGIGCAGVTGPRFGGPGPAEWQRAEAQRFDPYPEPEAGPTILGGRPRDYEEPIAEPSRARWNPLTWFNRQQRTW